MFKSAAHVDSIKQIIKSVIYTYTVKQPKHPKFWANLGKSRCLYAGFYCIFDNAGAHKSDFI